MCRHELFSRLPEQDMMQIIEDDYIRQRDRRHDESEEDYLARLARLGESEDSPMALTLFLYAPLLHLSGNTNLLLALNIAEITEDMPSGPFVHGPTAITAAAVYVTSHLLHEPRSLPEVARTTAVSERLIQNAYRTIYFNRYSLVDDARWRATLGGATAGQAAEVLPDLTWPPLQYEVMDGEGEHEGRMVEEYDSPETTLDLMHVLNYFFHGNYHTGDNPILIVANRIADEVAALVLDCYTPNPWTIAAACTYMASHLVLQGKTYEQVSAMSGVPADWIRSAYRVLYGARGRLVQAEWFGSDAQVSAIALQQLPEP